MVASLNNFVMCNIFLLLNADAFGPAQDPAREPARVTEGIVLVMMNHGDFFVTRKDWATFLSSHPHASFDDFWLKQLIYERNNVATRAFFSEFESDPVCHTRILADRALCHELH